MDQSNDTLIKQPLLAANQPITLKLVLPGVVPALKNKKIMKVNKKGQPYQTASDQWKKWYKWALPATEVWLQQQRVKYPMLQFPIAESIKLKCLFYFGDLRTRDILGKGESIQDLLVDAKVLYDDCYFIVGNVACEGKYIEPKKLPGKKKVVRTNRAEIYIVIPVVRIC